MRLLTKTSIYYLMFSLLLFTAGGVIFYMQVKGNIDEDVTEDLYLKKDKVLQYYKDSSKIPPRRISLDDEIIFTEQSVPINEQLRDTILVNHLDEEEQPYIQLIFPAKLGDKYYSVTINKAMFESEDLIESVITSFVITAALLIVSLFVFSRLVSKSFMMPFYRTLKAMQRFEVNKNEPIKLSPVKTSEFRTLNEVIIRMTDKILSDYRNLKEFTENASHEIQTPLAIIRSKLELMIQQENLSGEQMDLLQDIYESANRLSRLNQSLLLLSKIENRQFHEEEKIDLKALIENKLSQFEEMIAYRNIIVEKHLSGSTNIKMNLQLADILISNIIGNAIKHNINHGTIIIELGNNSLVISNSGTTSQMPIEKLFQRFQKANSSSDSAGLGLSIIKQITDNYNFMLNYKYLSDKHIISVTF